MNKSKIKLSVKRVRGSQNKIIDLIGLKELGKPTQSACVYVEITQHGDINYSSRGTTAADVSKEKMRRYKNQLLGYEVLSDQGWTFELGHVDSYADFLLQLEEVLLGGALKRGEEFASTKSKVIMRKFERLQELVEKNSGKESKYIVLTDNELTGAW